VDVDNVTTLLGEGSLTYNNNHDITSITDRVNKQTDFTHNEYGQVRTITSAAGTPDQSVTEFIYDPATHLLIEKKVNGSTVATYTHNEKGLIETSTDASGITLTYEYDNLNQITKIIWPDTKFMEYTYATCCPGQVESVTDRSGLTTYYEYDALKRLTEVRAPREVTRYEYDRNGNMTKLTDSNGNETLFEYDLMNRVSKKTYADTKAVDIETDEAGLTQNTLNARGTTVTYGYSNLDNIESITYTDTTPAVSYIYDTHGRVDTKTDGAGTFGYGYYADNKLQSVDGPWANDTVSYTYDELGRVKTITPMGGQTITYGYDNLGRTQTIQMGTDTFTYTYDGASPLVTSLTRPNGRFTEYLYDSQLKRLTAVTNWKSDKKTKEINSFGYTYNDQDYRENETITNGEPITSFTEGLTTYIYNNVNQITDSDGTTGPRTYTFDNDGGMTQGYTPEGYPFTATYDAEDRLTSIQYTDSGSVVHETHYTYGADDLLYEIRKVDGGAESITRIIRAGFLPIQERDGNNNIIREYVWGPGMGGGIGGLLAMKEGSNVYYYLYDGKGNVTALINTQGNVVATYSYDPFGVLTQGAGSLVQPFKFSTKRYDEQTGLSYYGYRFYSASLGRWITRDPLGEAGGMNLYGFVGNDPINWIDPMGLDKYNPCLFFEEGGALDTICKKFVVDDVGCSGPKNAACCHSQRDECRHEASDLSLTGSEQQKKWALCEKQWSECMMGTKIK
jgi:RHS repeat-associated protein